MPQPHNKTERQKLNPIARAMREAVQREGKDPLPKIQKLLRTLNDREEDVLRRRFGIPSEYPTPSSEELQRLFDLPSTMDEPSSDDKR